MNVAKIAFPKVDKPYRLTFTDRKYKVWLTEEQWDELIEWITRPGVEVSMLTAKVKP